ncbi:MAG: helix-turn-helix domain-containing protein [Candidatus Uhrbacteria bacterium]
MENVNLPLKNFLLSLAFSEKETNVYLALLTLGKGTVSEIARQAEMNRTTGYDILSKLVNYGLVSVSGKEPKQEYVAESPDKVVNFLENKKRETEKQIVGAKKFLPQLKSIHNIGSRPKIRFYEGKEGLKQVYEDTLTSHEAIRAYATVDDMHAALPDYFPKYYERRAKKGIHIRAIIPKTPSGIDRSKQDRAEARETALIPPDKYYFSPEINIYDNKIMIASWREKLGIIIESPEIADAMKKIYELAWTEAKRLDLAGRKSKNK